MTQILIKGAVVGFVFVGLSACAGTPAYPISADGLANDHHPAVVVASAEPAPAATAEPPPPAPAPVESAPLSPVAASPEPSPRAEAPAPEPARPEMVRPEVAPPPPPPRYTATGKVIEARKMFRDYKVAKGDHLDAIARDLQTTRAIIVEANHLKNPDALQPGQHLRIPIEKAYVAQSGDTLFAVAKRFGVSVEDLADLNGYSLRQKLRSGDQLALPASFHDGGPVLLPPAERVASRYRPSYEARPGSWVRSGREDIRPPQPYPTESATPSPALTDAQVAEAGRGRFVWPVRGEVLSSFGVKDVGRRNDGVDFKAAQGTPVRAAAAGDVVYAGDQVPGFGNLVLVKHADGWVTAYAHLDRVSVKMRDTVEQNQQIGEVGQTGGAAEPELHFEIRYAPSPTEKAKPIDPMLVLPH